jgi:hypothetical protein
MIKKLLLILCLLFFYLNNSKAQNSLDYYLPDSLTYNPAIPTPASVLGFEIGDWHLSHDQLVYYMRVLAQASDRITLEEYGRTHEKRPLLVLTITSPKNQQNIAQIQKDHVQLSDPKNSGSLDTEKMPSVVRLSYSVHGNEASGANSSALVAYHLAAGQSTQMDELLDKVIILLDPCINPDGFQRFSTWVNMHKSYQTVSDPISREFNEPFPRGRTNHYWFDVNRDWLLLQHPESQGRVANFHAWKPNILTDHHEMGSNSSFFFQPGVPSRNNPNTPARNLELTRAIGKYHAAALDAIGSLYYSEEGFDDFYYGKGSTYPDINGGIGILFEQASARGHAQDTDNGVLTFGFAIRNQFTASLSTLRAALGMRTTLLDYQRDFYKNVPKSKGAYVFGNSYDEARNYHLYQLLTQHQIEVYALDQEFSAEGKKFQKGKAFVVPLDQPQARLINTLFEKVTTFEDSIFYDISAWTMPLAFNLPYTKVGTVPSYSKDKVTQVPEGKLIGDKSEVGYLFHWDSYYAPRALHQILDSGLRAKVATRTATIPQNEDEIKLEYGSVFIPASGQILSDDRLKVFLSQIAKTNALTMYALPTGLTENGIDLGSSDMEALKHPRPMMIIGDGVNSYDAGEVWHLLDQRYQMPLTMVEQGQFSRADLSQYNTIIMVDGNYNDLNDSIAKIREWLQAGNTLICFSSANRWAIQQGLVNLKFKTLPSVDTLLSRYADRENLRGAQELGGAIFEAELDLTHPLGYGFRDSKMAVFKDNRLFAEMPSSTFNVPLKHTDNPRLSGYISKENLNLLKNSPVVSVNHYGRGQIISFLINPNFRAFWYGSNKLFANALFFGKVIGR